MIRVLIYLGILVVLGAVAAWVADHPGRVVLRWEHVQVETTVALLAVAVVVFALILTGILQLVRWLYIGPRRIRVFRAERRRQRGYRALTHGLVAAAAGNAPGAKKAAETAEGLLGEPPLTLLLTAQAAQLEGDTAAAKTAFRRMLDHDETEFLGLRGLIVQAVRAGDRATALSLARRAFEISPETAWVLSNLVELEIQAGDWQRAGRALDAAIAAGRIDKEDGRRRQALLLYQQGLAAADAGNDGQALKLARQALDRRPDFVPGNLLAARLMTAAGRGRQAQKLLERGWGLTAHPDLARAYIAAGDPAEPLDQVRALTTLTASHPDSREGHLVVAEAALAAELWGTAREHLGSAINGRPTARACRLMARLEEAENDDAAAARQWLVKATEADPDPQWLCTACGTPAPEWQLYCANCDAFDSLDWRAPATAPVALGEPPPTSLTTVTTNGSTDAERSV